jgi:hypothetical protein
MKERVIEKLTHKHPATVDMVHAVYQFANNPAFLIAALRDIANAIEASEKEDAEFLSVQIKSKDLK